MSRYREYGIVTRRPYPPRESATTARNLVRYAPGYAIQDTARSQQNIVVIHFNLLKGEYPNKL